MKSGFCVLWGRPNVGKSTLLNALLGRKHVIVSPRPQTTRHRIAGVLHSQNAVQNEIESHDDLVLNDEAALQNEVESDAETDKENSAGYQIVFLDTPGIHEPQHKLGEALVKTARGALQDIECVVFVGDATDKPHGDDYRAAELLKQQLGKQKVPVILALNKCDAVSEQELDTRRGEFQSLFDFDAKLTISAMRGDKLERLKSEIVERLPEGDPYFPSDMIGDRSPEFHIEELIREQAMLQLREEVPHAVAVNIEMMEPRKNGTLFVEAFINVERDSQKRIVIGAGGSRIKEIGQSARQEIENLMGRSVYLELRVKVRDKWRDNEMWIQRLGYDER